MVEFVKYSGAGNDFVLLDGRYKGFDLNTNQIKKLCDRKFGVGADGLLVVEKSEKYDFKMTYYNADGSKARMCANGARCMAHFVSSHPCDTKCSPGKMLQFEVGSDVYYAQVFDNEVELTMESPKVKRLLDLSLVQNYLGYSKLSSLMTCAFYCECPVPVATFMLNDDINLNSLNIVEDGKILRHWSEFKEGANIVFVQKSKSMMNARIYERGVEDETLSSGTGAVGAFVACEELLNVKEGLTFKMPGGLLSVSKVENSYFLKGPVELTFTGKVEKI